MGFSFSFSSKVNEVDAALPSIFPFALNLEEFIKSDVLGTYLKILTDTMERTHGVSKEDEPALWDNCLQNEASRGLISHLAQAMTDKADLFLVYKNKVIRKATSSEQREIEKDYKEKGESKVGIYVSFKNYHRTDMLRVYSTFEHCILSSMNKNLNLAKAIQIKIHDLRASTSLNDSTVAKGQAQSIATALGLGKDVLLDKLDEIITANVDTAPAEKAVLFLDSKRAFLLSLPLSYISGEQTPGIGSTGEADMRAVERGLKQYFVSILRPVLKAIFGVDVVFKSLDFKQLSGGIEMLKVFDMTDEKIISLEAKRAIAQSVFDLDPDEEEENFENAEDDEEDTPPTDPQTFDPNGKPVVNPVVNKPPVVK